jgi:hypothetical protein
MGVASVDVRARTGQHGALPRVRLRLRADLRSGRNDPVHRGGDRLRHRLSLHRAHSAGVVLTSSPDAGGATAPPALAARDC